MKKIGLLMLLFIVVLPLQAQNNYFTGNGGAGQSLTVLAPNTGKNLDKEEDFLPNLVQSTIADDFIHFSKIETRNWRDVEKVLAQTEELVYAENPDIMAAGNLTQTQYILSGDLTKTSTGYLLSLTITDTKTGRTKASYNKPCSKEKLETTSGIKDASADLLAQMGVDLTTQGKKALLGINDGAVQGQISMAKGTTALRRGGEAEALFYYNMANAYDPSLQEAAGRVSVLQANISSGNIGEDARNDVRWRRDWAARLNEANKFFADYIANNLPPCELIYSTNMEAGKIDYSSETMPFTFPVRLFTDNAYFASLEKAVQTVTDGLAATKRNSDWGLIWPGDFARYRTFPVTYDVDFDLVNSANAVTGTRVVRLGFSWGISGGDKIEISRPSPGTEQVTITAKVDDITDTLVIKVRAVNGKDPAAANVRISPINETPPPDNAYGIDRVTGELYYADANGVIPASIWGVPVTSIRSDSKLDLGGKAVIPDSVKRIGRYAINMHPLRRNGIVTMKKDRDPVLFSFTIGADVSLERESFYTNVTPWNPNNPETSDYQLTPSEHLYGFTEFYNRNGKKAGTYSYTFGNRGSFIFLKLSYEWSYRP
ncbi:hypothetical protein FACS1894124_2410 [Spirochaetia bacterium]|nr:hypothetical protein FACS1894124_2410 [Spirochaetia bacterium]